MIFREQNRTQKLDAYAARRLQSRWKSEALATACGVSLRTAYRWRASFRELRVIAVEDFEADFVIRHKQPPVRVSAWRKAA